MTVNKEQKDAINLIKFLLAIGIVASHGSFMYMKTNGIEQMGGAEFDGYRTIITILRDITSLCVPLFFVISGYLLFIKVGNSELSMSFFADKIKNRCKGLLVPFFIANIIMLCVLLGINSLKPALSDYSIQDFNLQSFVNWLWIKPVMGPTWFIRELFVAVLLSPVLYIFIKYIKHSLAFVILLLLVWGVFDFCGMDWQLTPYGINIMAIAFFVLGSYLAVHEIDILKLSDSLFKYALPVWLLCVCFVQHMEFLRLPLLISAFIIIIKISHYFAKRHSFTRLQEWTTASFFVYLYHYYLVIFSSKVLFSLIAPSDGWGAFLVYALSITITLISLFAIYFIIKKIMPRVVSVIVGGR